MFDWSTFTARAARFIRQTSNACAAMTGKGLAVRTSLSAPPRVPAAEMHNLRWSRRTPLAFPLLAVHYCNKDSFSSVISFVMGELLMEHTS